MKKVIVALTVAFLASMCASPRDFQSEFDVCLEDNDTLKQRTLLQDWEKAKPKDPELFIGYFNYYFNKSIDEAIAVNYGEDEDVSFEGEEAYNPKWVQAALDKISRGIALYPDRLDMRFGKIHALGMVEDWEAYTEEIVGAIKQSAKNKCQWLWENNEALAEDSEDIFLSSMQDYQVHLYNQGDADLLPDMRTIADEILKIYPDHVESLSNISATYLIVGEMNKALEVLVKAHAINPYDIGVLRNMLYAYNEKDDHVKSIECLEKIIEYTDDEDLKESAEQTLQYHQKQLAK